MNARQKQLAILAGAAVALILLYRAYSNRGTAAATTGAVAPDTASGDYASLAGQEQSDMAAMQGQNSQLLAQEQSDVASLGASIGATGAQEQADVSGLTGQIAGYSDQFDALIGSQAAMSASVAGLASGVTALNRARTESILTHRGGPFYKYYVKITGHPPPRTVRTSDWIYQAWKSGVKSSALTTTPAKPHPSAKNTHVAHPNPAHKQQTHTKPKPAAPAAPKPQAKPKGAAPAPKPRPKPKPLPRPKAKPSGTRK